MGTIKDEALTPRLWGVIVTYRRAEVLRQTMRKIENQTKPVDNLIVVDNGSEPGVANAAKTNSPIIENHHIRRRPTMSE